MLPWAFRRARPARGCPVPYNHTEVAGSRRMATRASSIGRSTSRLSANVLLLHYGAGSESVLISEKGSNSVRNYLAFGSFLFWAA